MEELDFGQSDREKQREIVEERRTSRQRAGDWFLPGISTFSERFVLSSLCACSSGGTS